MFSCEFCVISKNTFSTEHLRWLLLKFTSDLSNYFRLCCQKEMYKQIIRYLKVVFMILLITKELVFHWFLVFLVQFCFCNFIWNLLQVQASETGRSSRPEVFCKKSVLKSFTKFTGKHLCQTVSLLIMLQASGNFIGSGLQLY